MVKERIMLNIRRRQCACCQGWEADQPTDQIVGSFRLVLPSPLLPRQSPCICYSTNAHTGYKKVRGQWQRVAIGDCTRWR